MESVRIMLRVLLVIASVCEVIYGDRGGRSFCPIPGGRNVKCVEPERCALPVHLRYFGYFWRRRGVPSFCTTSRGRNARILVCCLRLIRASSGSEEVVSDKPIWTVPETDTVLWNGTAWIDDDEEDHERIVTMDPVYQTKCKEYTQAATDVNNRVGSNGGGLVIHTMIVGGIKTKSKEFPHMALLGFGPEENISWRCGGTLISATFVMTAAHCVYTEDMGPVTFVRLGDLDISTETDDADPQQFRIINRYQHPGYASLSHYNDIALLELDHPATFTKYVRPACLPSDGDLTNAQLIATGWGALEYGGSINSDLMKVDLRYYSTDQCKQTFPPQARIENGIDGDSQICAGGVDESKDTCQGDSGGPLQIQTSNSPVVYEVVGITSFGRGCGTVNMPAVYTKVAHFVPWIEQIVWPNGSK